MVVTMPARRRDLRNWRYFSQLRSLLVAVVDVEGVVDEKEELAEKKAGAVGLSGPLLPVNEVAEKARTVEGTSAGWTRAMRDEDAPADRAAYLEVTAEADMIDETMEIGRAHV